MGRELNKSVQIDANMGPSGGHSISKEVAKKNIMLVLRLNRKK